MDDDKKKSKLLFIALKLTVICFAAVILLIVVNIITAPFIIRNNEKVEKEANKELMPEGNNFIRKNFSSLEEKQQKKYYYFEVQDSSGNIIGYIASAITNGYGGNMKLMIAFDKNLVIKNLKLLENSETPGIGKEFEKPKRMAIFIDTNSESKPLPVKKYMLENPDSVSGATISFNAIVKGIQRAIELLNNQLK